MVSQVVRGELVCEETCVGRHAAYQSAAVTLTLEAMAVPCSSITKTNDRTSVELLMGS